MAPKKCASIHRNELLAKLVIENKAPCAFCQRKVNDEVIYGKLYAIGDIQCHYFCVLLSSCLVQRGKDNEGLFGFLYADIVAEVERSKKHRCSFCSRNGATLGCSIGQCKKQFHLPCGRERQAISLFYGNYKSFCNQHAPKQTIPDNIMVNARLRMNLDRKKTVKKPNNFSNLKELSPIKVCNELQAVETESVCVICYEEVDGYPTVNTFWPPCCARDAWFHRSCLQRMALSAGMHYLKCPLCNDKKKFYRAVVSQGYYVPDRDAAWELEQNAFAEIYERPISCDAVECKCPMGRGHDADTGAWDIKLCLLCGSAGVHVQCGEANIGDAGENDGTNVGVRVGRHVCRVCLPAAPADLEQLANTIQQVILEEQNQNVNATRSGPIMPSRMSLRRTKQRINAHNIASTSTFQTNPDINTDQDKTVHTSRQDLNLKTPRKLPTPELRNPLKSIDNKTTPVKLLQQGLNEKVQNMGLKDVELNDHVMNVVTRKLQKPRPLCVKKRIVNDLLDGILDTLQNNHKKKEPIKEWHSPKKTFGNQDLVSEEPMLNVIEVAKSVEDSATVEIPQKIEEAYNSRVEPTSQCTDLIEDSDKSVEEMQIFDTPKKLKTVDIQKDSSLEISANDEVVNISVIKIEDFGDQSIETPQSNKCAFKFSPTNSALKDNIDIMDLESFKNQYLNEVDRYKCNFNHHHIKTEEGKTKIRTAIDFAIDASLKKKSNAKRKADVEKRCSKRRKVKETRKNPLDDSKVKEKEKRKKRKSKTDNIKFRVSRTEKENKTNKLKTKLSISNRNIQVKIQFRKEKLDLEIRKSKTKNKKRKIDKKLKQCVLKYFNDYNPSNDVLEIPEKDVTPIKRKYIKQEKTPDNLKQTSIQSFFKVMAPKE